MPISKLIWYNGEADHIDKLDPRHEDGYDVRLLRNTTSFPLLHILRLVHDSGAIITVTDPDHLPNDVSSLRFEPIVEGNWNNHTCC